MKQTLLVLFTLLWIQSFAQQNKSVEYKKAEALFSNQKYKEALAIFNSLIEKDPQNADLWSWKGACLRDLNKYEDAMDCYNKSVALAPNIPVSYYHRGCFFININQQDYAIHDFTDGLKYASEKDSFNYMLLYTRSQAYFYKHAYDSARMDIEAALRHDTTNAVYLCHAYIIEMAIKQFDKALKYLDRWKRVKPEDVVVSLNYAYTYESMGQYKKAIEINSQLLSKCSKQYLTNVYDNRGFEKLQLNDVDGAMADINKAIQLDTTNSYAYKNRALVYLAMYQKKNACIDLKKALELNYTPNYGDEAKDLLDKHCK